MPTIVIDDEANDDWMKTLPGYENEMEIIDAVVHPKKERAVVYFKGVAAMRNHMPPPTLHVKVNVP